MLDNNNGGTSKVKLIVLGIITGLFSGMVAVLYRFVLAELDGIRDAIYTMDVSRNYIWLILVAIIFGICVVYLLRWAPFSGGSGIPQIRGELLGRISMAPALTFVSKFLGGSMANFIGLSLGREGPSIQLGGIIGKVVAKVLKTDKLTSNYLISAGASAGLSAAFNAPIAGTLFTLEEMYGSFSHNLLLPSIVASITANYVSYTLAGKLYSFSFTITQTLEMEMIGWVILVGAISGLIGVLFNHTMERTRQFFAWTKLKPLYLIPIIFVLTVFVGMVEPDLLGGGHHLVEHMVAAPFSIKALITLLFGKLIFTSISYNSGVQGGIFLPVLVLGAITGLLIYRLSGLESMYLINFIILGMAAVMTSVVRAPIMSIVLVMEMTGSFTHLIMISVASVSACLVAELTRTEPIYETLYHNLKVRFQPIEEKGTPVITTKYKINPDSDLVGKSISELRFPIQLLITNIEREGEVILAKGNELIRSQDTLTVAHNVADSEVVQSYFT